jgi:hypothetical protein
MLNVTPPSAAAAAYLKAGIRTEKVSDDSSGVNVHGTLPTRWVQMGMLLLNLVVWLEATLRLTGAFQAA